MSELSKIFGSQVFNDSVMRAKLPTATYNAVKNIIENNLTLDSNLAEAIASAMKEWAIEKGATHYSHWFQPMTGMTAEKHDSFLSTTKDGNIIMEFSGKELIKVNLMPLRFRLVEFELPLKRVDTPHGIVLPGLCEG